MVSEGNFLTTATTTIDSGLIPRADSLHLPQPVSSLQESYSLSDEPYSTFVPIDSDYTITDSNPT